MSKLDKDTIKLMTAQHVTNTYANYEANMNNAPEQSGGGSSTHENNSNIPRACTYEEFMNYKPIPFHDNEGVVGMTLDRKDGIDIPYQFFCENLSC